MTIQVGDTVYRGSGAVHWTVLEIEDRIDPLGVVLKSQLTGRTARDTYENLHPFRGEVR